ncbi:unnamed protein product [Protopolystoma xenopodis]|uniref:Uncharacterized protein n=1 Tax=Protopolystoma xenopodis TaxID=117903 RepID=A0A448WGY9_9PLAT|nr:unnamed protein product [Protopolystoma xenopodis]
MVAVTIFWLAKATELLTSRQRTYQDEAGCGGGSCVTGTIEAKSHSITQLKPSAEILTDQVSSANFQSRSPVTDLAVSACLPLLDYSAFAVIVREWNSSFVPEPLSLLARSLGNNSDVKAQHRDLHPGESEHIGHQLPFTADYRQMATFSLELLKGPADLLMNSDRVVKTDFTQ